MTRLSSSEFGRTTTVIRLLRTADVAAAVELSMIAGWNQTADDWSMLIELAPEGCFGIEADGALVSTTTLLCYGQRLAWIGMVLTKPSYRGRGFARALVTHAIEMADSMGVKAVKLDATDQGQPLYQRLGFVAEGAIERWSRAGSANLPAAVGRFHSAQVFESDFAAFGADRGVVLENLAKRSHVSIGTNAYLFARAGRTTGYVGPCIARDPGSARALVTSTVASSSAAWSWDLLPRNPNAVALASELGFTRQRVLTRMRRGDILPSREDMVYAIAGFELG